MGTVKWERYGAEGRGRLLAVVAWPFRRLAGLLRVRKVCRNWVQFLAFRCHLRRRVSVRLRYGAVLRVVDRPGLRSAVMSEAWSLGLLNAYCGPVAWDGEWLGLRYRGKAVRFRCGAVREYHSVLREQFADEQYRWLDVGGREVLDVGGSIGDSAIYFALSGARSVLALEPYPASFELLEANVAGNGLEGIITPLLAGAGRDGSIQVSVSVASGSAALRECAGGASVPTYSLASLLARGEWRDAVAKIDCEGGEYPFILGASERDLRRFSRCIIEYHHGPFPLAEKLAGAGFRVWYTAGEADVDSVTGAPCLVGLLRAERVR